MNLFISNLILAFAWAAIAGEISLAKLLWGFFIAFILLFTFQRIFGPTKYFIKLRLFISLVIFLAYSLVVASLWLAFDIFTPRHRMRPGIIAVPLEAKTDEEILFLSNLISLTPGTLSLDVSDDRKFLFVHVMYIGKGDVEQVRKSIKQDWERRVLELLR